MHTVLVNINIANSIITPIKNNTVPIKILRMLLFMFFYS